MLGLPGMHLQAMLKARVAFQVGQPCNMRTKVSNELLNNPYPGQTAPGELRLEGNSNSIILGTYAWGTWRKERQMIRKKDRYKRDQDCSSFVVQAMVQVFNGCNFS